MLLVQVKDYLISDRRASAIEFFRHQTIPARRKAGEQLHHLLKAVRVLKLWTLTSTHRSILDISSCTQFNHLAMGLLTTVLGPLAERLSGTSSILIALLSIASFVVLVVISNVLKQSLFTNPNEPPMVFHWFPIIGSAVSYGMDPYVFFFRCREKV